ncbi:MAG: DNA starvation/stationary phase protection protein Dps [Acidobacteriota bacterium]
MSNRMIHTKNDLPVKTRRQMVELLDARLADVMDLYSHAKHAHWNVRGARFLSLHELFDKVAEMAEGQADEIAERAAQLGGEVHGTMRAGAKATSLREYPLNIGGVDEHVEAMASSLAAFGKNVREGIDTSDKADDMDTSDMFTDISRAVDKMLWFVESHQAPQQDGKKMKDHPESSAA